jgi:integrase
VRGLGVRITRAGARSWVLNFHIAGRERRLTIGSTLIWPVKLAREEGKRLRRLVDQGIDPLQQRQAERAAIDIGELLDEYLAAAKAKRSFRPERATVEKILRPRWGARKVGSITLDDVERLHQEISRRNGPIRANRVVACASAVFRLAIKRRYIPDNPCRGVERNAETKRARYLSLEELARLVAVLEAWPDPVPAAAIRLLLLTGCRRGELLRATWSEFDLAAGLWIKPVAHCKNKREHRVPLSPEAVAVIDTLPRYNSHNLLFPNGMKRPWSEIRAWPAIRAAAGIEDVHIHDLRHSAASMMVSAGNSLELIGGVLGHSQASTHGALRAPDGWGAAPGGRRARGGGHERSGDVTIPTDADQERAKWALLQAQIRMAERQGRCPSAEARRSGRTGR